MRSQFATIKPVLIITIRGKYCSGCSYMYYGTCSLFGRPLKNGDMGYKRCEHCIKAEVKKRKKCS